MEFMCVLSVEGSLATYIVQQQTDEQYTASLRTAGGRHTGIPAEITLTKTAEGWTGNPPYPEIVRGLSNAIEAQNR